MRAAKSDGADGLRGLEVVYPDQLGARVARSTLDADRLAGADGDLEHRVVDGGGPQHEAVDVSVSYAIEVDALARIGQENESGIGVEAGFGDAGQKCPGLRVLERVGELFGQYDAEVVGSAAA